MYNKSQLQYNKLQLHTHIDTQTHTHIHIHMLTHACTHTFKQCETIAIVINVMLKYLVIYKTYTTQNTRNMYIYITRTHNTRKQAMAQIRAAQAKDGMAPVTAPAAPSLLPQPVVAAAGAARAPVSSMCVYVCV